MSTTIVFACKSNSCRSQMAEGWAREWIESERRGLDVDGGDGDGEHAYEEDGHRRRRRRRLRSFLDGLMVVSVALDESSVAEGGKSSTADASSIPSVKTPLGTSPTSSLTTSFEAASISSSVRSCVTCDGELCTSSSGAKRRRPKEKAIKAMAEDGVDISSYRAKSFDQVLPDVLKHHRRCNSNVDVIDHQVIGVDSTTTGWTRRLSLSGLRNILETASREMGMAYAVVAREADDVIYGAESNKVVDNLVVLCSCPDSLKRSLSQASRETFEWDVDPPSAAASSSEGDGAYLRVSRQIRRRVEEYMDRLKECALADDDGDEYAKLLVSKNDDASRGSFERGSIL